MTSSRLFSGGFYVTRPLPLPDGLAGEVPLPERLLTLSSCLTELLPDTWALEWSSCEQSERIAAIEKLGIAPDRLPELMQHATAAFDRGELGWSCVWQTLAAARVMLERFSDVSSDLEILELGVPEGDLPRLLTHLAPKPREGKSGLYLRLESPTALAESGVSVGWELLGVELGGSYHSWLCNHLQDDAAARLGFTPGPFGLLGTEQQARAVAELIEQGLGAEPVPWFPGLLRRIARG